MTDNFYEITVLASDSDLSIFGLGHAGHSFGMTTAGRYDNGVVKIGSCACVEYDTLIEKNGEPLTAFCSDDDYYFFRTMLALMELEEFQPTWGEDFAVR